MAKQVEVAAADTRPFGEQFTSALSEPFKGENPEERFKQALLQLGEKTGIQVGLLVDYAASLFARERKILVSDAPTDPIAAIRDSVNVNFGAHGGSHEDPSMVGLKFIIGAVAWGICRETGNQNAPIPTENPKTMYRSVPNAPISSSLAEMLIRDSLIHGQKDAFGRLPNVGDATDFIEGFASFVVGGLDNPPRLASWEDRYTATRRASKNLLEVVLASMQNTTQLRANEVAVKMLVAIRDTYDPATLSPEARLLVQLLPSDEKPQELTAVATEQPTATETMRAFEEAVHIQVLMSERARLESERAALNGQLGPGPNRRRSINYDQLNAVEAHLQRINKELAKREAQVQDLQRLENIKSELITAMTSVAVRRFTDEGLKHPLGFDDYIRKDFDGLSALARDYSNSLRGKVHKEAVKNMTNAFSSLYEVYSNIIADVKAKPLVDFVNEVEMEYFNEKISCMTLTESEGEAVKNFIKAMLMMPYLNGTKASEGVKNNFSEIAPQRVNIGKYIKDLSAEDILPALIKGYVEGRFGYLPEH